MRGLCAVATWEIWFQGAVRHIAEFLVYMSLKITDSSRLSQPQVDLLDSGVNVSRLHPDNPTRLKDRLLGRLHPTESEFAATLVAAVLL
jgi:hypothetical protein